MTTCCMTCSLLDHAEIDEPQQPEHPIQARYDSRLQALGQSSLGSVEAEGYL